MDNWKIHLAVVTFVALLRADPGLCSRAEERRLRDRQGGSLETRLTQPMAGLLKKSRVNRFHGLMGKRSGNEGEAFARPAGRGISFGEPTRVMLSMTTTTIDASKKPHKQGLPEEWVEILY